MKHKISKKNMECQSNRHQFIVSNWTVAPNFQRVNGVMCQRCLYMIEGINEIRETIEALHVRNEDAEAENPSVIRKDIGDKSDKGSGGKGKEADRQAG